MTSRNAPKLTQRDAVEIRRRHAKGESIGALALAYGVSHTSIRPIVRGESYPAEITIPVPDELYVELLHDALLEGMPLETYLHRIVSSRARPTSPKNG